MHNNYLLDQKGKEEGGGWTGHPENMYTNSEEFEQNKIEKLEVWHQVLSRRTQLAEIFNCISVTLGYDRHTIYRLWTYFGFWDRSPSWLISDFNSGSRYLCRVSNLSLLICLGYHVKHFSMGQLYDIKTKTKKKTEWTLRALLFSTANPLFFRISAILTTVEIAANR